MAIHTFNALKIDPKYNPAVLDTATWDESYLVHELSDFHADSLQGGDISKIARALPKGIQMITESHESVGGRDWALCESDDGQNFFISLGARDDSVLGSPFFTKKLRENWFLCAYPAKDSVIDRFVTFIQPDKSPKPLGAIPRLGIGNRHTTTIWPGIWKAMEKKHFAANAIQNSVRELHQLQTLLVGEPARVNHLYSFGKMKEGHTGSTFEGLWTAGVLSALKNPGKNTYGADADHLQVKRGTEGVSRTKKLIDSAQYFTFYTMDVSDILEYAALTSLSFADIRSQVNKSIPSASLRTELVDYHKRNGLSIQRGSSPQELNEEMILRFMCKYWGALDALTDLDFYLKNLKQGRGYDLELSIDETPSDFSVFKAITTNEELQFLINEIHRRGIAVTHIAPNFGVEKGVNYRAPGGLPSLEHRVSQQIQIAARNGLMLDCHSGDDLSRETRRVFGRATKGNIHFKVSPYLQVLYAKTLEKINPHDFRIWWEDTLAYAKESAEQGSSTAIESLALLSSSDWKLPSADHLFFREYNFATVGKRDNAGNFLFRSMFYSQGAEFQSELDQAVADFLCECAQDLFEVQ